MSNFSKCKDFSDVLAELNRMADNVPGVPKQADKEYVYMVFEAFEKGKDAKLVKIGSLSKLVNRILYFKEPRNDIEAMRILQDLGYCIEQREVIK